MWARGMLSDQYGIAYDSVRWVQAGETTMTRDDMFGQRPALQNESSKADWAPSGKPWRGSRGDTQPTFERNRL